MRYHFRKIDRNVVMNTSDSGDSSYIRSTQLLGGIISIIWGKYQNYINIETSFQDEKGQ